MKDFVKLVFNLQLLVHIYKVNDRFITLILKKINLQYNFLFFMNIFLDIQAFCSSIYCSTRFVAYHVRLLVLNSFFSFVLPSFFITFIIILEFELLLPFL